jgi:hypothetical protein
MNKNIGNIIGKKRKKRIAETFVGMMPMSMLFINARVDVLLVYLPMWRTEQYNGFVIYYLYLYTPFSNRRI